MVQVKFQTQQKGRFWISDKMSIAVSIHVELSDGELIVRRTSGIQKQIGQKLAVKVLKEVVHFARLHQLKVIASSDFVQQQFHKRPNAYGDIWEKVEQ